MTTFASLFVWLLTVASGLVLGYLFPDAFGIGGIVGAYCNRWLLGRGVGKNAARDISFLVVFVVLALTMGTMFLIIAAPSAVASRYLLPLEDRPITVPLLPVSIVVGISIRIKAQNRIAARRHTHFYPALPFVRRWMKQARVFEEPCPACEAEK